MSMYVFSSGVITETLPPVVFLVNRMIEIVA